MIPEEVCVFVWQHLNGMHGIMKEKKKKKKKRDLALSTGRLVAVEIKTHFHLQVVGQLGWPVE